MLKSTRGLQQPPHGRSALPAFHCRRSLQSRHRLRDGYP